MVHYRKVIAGLQTNPKTFEAACRNVLSENNQAGVALWSRVLDRMFSDPEGMQQQIVVNRVADLTSSVFGELCLVDRKGMQALLEQSHPSKVELSDVTTAEIYDLEERYAPQGTQFIRGMAYWLTIGDHLFFVKTSSMSARLMEKYFTWLLAGKQSGYVAGSTITLQAEFAKGQVSGDIGDIRNLVVKGGSAPQFTANVLSGEEREVSTSRKVLDRFVQFSQAIDVVKAIVGEEKTKSLVESLGPEEYLAVDTSVKVRGRRTEKSKAQLRQLTNDLADLTDGTIQVEGKNGKLSDGDAILRTKMPFELVEEGATLLEFNNVADQLQEVYSRFVRDGMIEA